MNDAHAALLDAAQILFEGAPGQSSGFDLGGARAQRAEHHQGLPVLGNGVQSTGTAGDKFRTAEHMAQDHRAGRVRVGIHMAGKATHQIEHALEHGGCVVKASAAGPAVGTGKDRFIAPFPGDAADLVGHQGGGLLPTDRHKTIRAALLARTRVPALQPAFAHHRREDAPLRAGPFGDRVDDRRGGRVLGEGFNADDLLIFNQEGVGAPMAAMGDAAYLTHLLWLALRLSGVSEMDNQKLWSKMARGSRPPNAALASGWTRASSRA